MSPMSPSNQQSPSIASQRDIPSLNGLGLPTALVTAVRRLFSMVYDVRDLVFTQGGQACLVYALNVQTTMQSSTPTAINFDTAAFDTAGAWGGSGSQLKINQPGVYAIYGTGSFTSSGSGTFRQVYVRVNGTLALATSTFGVTALVFGPPPSIWRFKQGDYVELVQQQDTGSSLANTASQVTANLGIVRLTN